MPKIPEFETRQLASQVVGTPGVDTSNERIFNAASRFLGNLAGVSVGLHRLQQSKQQKALLQQQALAKKRQQSFIDASAMSHIASLDAEIEKATIDFQQEFEENPFNVSKPYQNRLEGMINDRLEGIENADVRGIVRKKMFNSLPARTRSISKWESSQQVKTAFNKAVSSSNDFAVQAYQAGKIGGQEGFQRMLQIIKTRVPDMIVTYDQILSKEQTDQLKQDIPKSVVNGYLTGLIENQPIEAKEALSGGVFDKMLSPQEKVALKKDADRAVTGLQKKIEIDRLASDISSNMDLYDKMKQGTLSLPLIDERIKKTGSTPFLRNLRSSIISNDDRSFAVSNVERARFMDRVNLAVSQAKEGDLSRKEIIQKMIDLQAEGLELRNRGVIPDGDYERVLKDVTTPLADSVLEETGRRGVVDAVTDKLGLNAPDRFLLGFRMINKYLESLNAVDDPALKMAMAEDLHSLMRKAEQEKMTGKDFREEVIAMMNTHTGLAEGVKIDINGAIYVIRGFGENGEPFLEQVF